MYMRFLAGLVLLACSWHALAEKDEFTLNLKDVDIHTLIETVADATGKNFIVDPRITGNISVVTSTPMRASQVYDVFLSILKVHGYSAIPSGNVIKIVPNTNAKQDGNDSELRSSSQKGDEQLTRIIQVHHVSSTLIVQTLQPLMPQYAFIAAVPDSNTVILSDTADNVNRLASIVKQIDKVSDQTIEIINLKHASAAELIQPLNTLISATEGGKAPGASTTSLVADDRTNSILYSANPDMRLQIRALIANLDTPLENDGNTEVIYMRYAQAKELLETLTGIVDKKDGQGQAAAAPRPGGNTAVDIKADESANALIITAPSGEMRSIKSVIRQLDVRRAQVHIEAIIAELSFTKAQEIGIDWQTSATQNGVQATTRLPTTSTTGSSIASFASQIGQGLSIGYFAGGQLRALLSAFARDSDVNLLSTPSIVTLDNEEASIIVGQNIPLVTGQFTTNQSTGGTNPFQTVQRQDVGVKLKVLPQISAGNAVKLKVTQEVSAVNSASSSAGIQFDKREIQTSVLVDDGNTLVLGGLINDNFREGVNKIPILGDIPFIGHLFQSSQIGTEKSNLMVFLQPKILRDAGQSSVLTIGKYGQIRELERQIEDKGSFIFPPQRLPLLNELKDNPPASPAPDSPAEVAPGLAPVLKDEH
ncbi:MAG: type II secretion system protein GspD [Methylomonas sp.]|nr:MAG: type II secretion system protein GspD [Methylobacter sp.]PPD37029.1 MAG: type II secretion system protein GspD [Methylomonas sp.]